MTISIVYLCIGVVIGFLVSHELYIKNQKKRVQKRIKSVAKISLEPYDDTLELIRELNRNLVKMPSYQKTQKKEM